MQYVKPSRRPNKIQIFQNQKMQYQILGNSKVENIYWKFFILNVWLRKIKLMDNFKENCGNSLGLGPGAKFLVPKVYLQ